MRCHLRVALARVVLILLLHMGRCAAAQLLPSPVETPSVSSTVTSTASSSAAEVCAGELRPLLESAFARAFSTGEEFQATALFERLGYSPEQVKAIVEVTPRPATLSVDCDPGPITPGNMHRLKVKASGVHYYNLLIQEAVLDFSDTELDQNALRGGQIRFKRASSVGIETRVAAQDILKVFGFFASARKLSDLRLSITPKATTLSGKIRRGIFTAQFSVTGAAAVEKPKQINFQCRRMIINGLSLPRAAIRSMFSHVNPVFDAGRTWLNLELDNLVNEDGAVLSIGRLLGPPAPTVASTSSSSADISRAAVLATGSANPGHPLPLPLPMLRK